MFGDSIWQGQIPTNKPVDSQSILPIVKNQVTQIRPWALSELFKLITDSLDGKTIRNTEYKLLKFDYGHEELYNISIDSLETNNLIAGNLSATDLANYTYLCNELNNLVGSSAICNSITGVDYNNAEARIPGVYPNPFYSHIRLDAKYDEGFCIMTDCLGQLIYTGVQIQSQDFSNLPAGVYFVHIRNHENRLTHTQKLIKN